MTARCQCSCSSQAQTAAFAQISPTVTIGKVRVGTLSLSGSMSALLAIDAGVSLLPGAMVTSASSKHVHVAADGVGERQSSNGPRIRLGQLLCVPHTCALERLDRGRDVDVDHSVELITEPGVEVVRETLGLRAVDDPDCPLELTAAESRRVEQEVRHTGLVKESLPAPREGGADEFPLGRAAPVRGGSDAARVRGEADKQRLGAVPLPNELPDIELPALTHLCCACIAQMRVVRPDRDLRRPVALLEMRDELVERLRHVTVAQIPASRS